VGFQDRGHLILRDGQAAARFQRDVIEANQNSSPDLDNERFRVQLHIHV
jgi:hypothetical protein